MLKAISDCLIESKAQALAEDFIIITHDKQFSKYPVLIEGF